MIKTLQNIQFPSDDVCNRIKMFFDGDKCFVNNIEHYCVIPHMESLGFLTYFNSFSIGKWKKYTRLECLYLNLELKGKALVKIEFSKIINNNYLKNTIFTRAVDQPDRGHISIELPMDLEDGIISFSIIAQDKDVLFFGGCYYTEVEDENLPDVHLAIDICTFKREKYVIQNLNHLKKNIIDNVKSPLYEKLDIFVSDNAKTLPEDIQSEHIRIFKNKNLGGSGGFGRGMYEILKEKEKSGFTHILLMDDDVRISYEALLRTASFIRFLKPEYESAFIGGHMLKLDAMNIQSESSDCYQTVSHKAYGMGFDMENPSCIVENEKEFPVNFICWWYCCMPISVVREDNLPVPIFIKRDDMEYGLRNGKHFIVLNGINVWHEPFDYKYSSYLKYYYYRNLLIVDAKHRPSLSWKHVWKYIGGCVIREVLCFRYKDAQLILFGVQDYLKGIDWLKRQDGEKLNQTLMPLGYKKMPIDQLDWDFNYEDFQASLGYKEKALKKAFRLMLLNGWVFAGGKKKVVPIYKPHVGLFFKAKKVLNYEESSGTGFITEKDYNALFSIIKLYFKTRNALKKNYCRLQKEYSSRFSELTNKEFWEKYLFEDGEVPAFVSVIPEKKRPKSSWNDRKRLLKAYIALLLQGVLFFIPINNNRIMLCVNKRRGFSCNPKYVAKKLLEMYGDKLELIWITQYPETCQEQRDLGMKVVRMGSAEHLKLYLKTRVYVTNYMFPAWALHKKNQLWINTWHGAISYKHIGYDYLAPKSKIWMKVFRLENRTPDHYLSATSTFTEDTSKSFRFDKSIFRETGLPRNDLFFEEHPELYSKIRECYRIDDDKKIVLFAPTFRRGMKSDTYGIDFNRLKKALSEKYGGEWIVLFRNHTFVTNEILLPDGVRDVTKYPDMNELLYISDVLISDYSSCMYDFSLQKKPCFVYASDIDYFDSSDRSLAIPVNEWPYPIAHSNDELEKNIIAFDEDDYIRNLNDHYEKVGGYDKGTASETVVRIISEYCPLNGV